MTSELASYGEENHKSKMIPTGGGGGDAVYGIGLFGAWVFYMGRATTPQERFLGFLKGLVWPAFLVYELLKFLNPEEEPTA